MGTDTKGKEKREGQEGCLLFSPREMRIQKLITALSLSRELRVGEVYRRLSNFLPFVTLCLLWEGLVEREEKGEGNCAVPKIEPAVGWLWLFLRTSDRVCEGAPPFPKSLQIQAHIRNHPSRISGPFSLYASMRRRTWLPLQGLQMVKSRKCLVVQELG